MSRCFSAYKYVNIQNGIRRTFKYDFDYILSDYYLFSTLMSNGLSTIIP